MWPSILHIGSFTLSSDAIFGLLGLFAAGFVIWRRGREEHYLEDQLFDHFLVSTLFGLLVSRLVFIALHFDQFGLNLNAWLDLIGVPGLSLAAGVLAAGFYLAKLCRQSKWDVFEILDLWVVGVSVGLGIVHLGSFLAGTGVGNATMLPWGLIFPGQLEPHHPAQLYTAGFYLALTAYLWWVEYHYRTFTWYRRGKRAAQTGFLVSTFMIFSGLFLFLRSYIQPPTVQWADVAWDQYLYLALITGGLLLLLYRSDRFKWPWTKQKQPLG